MTRAVLVLYVRSARARWWRKHLQTLLPGIECKLWDDTFRSEDVEYAVVWSPPNGWLAGFENLKCIVSIGAGIDHVLADSLLPQHVPVIRTTGPDLTQRMREYITLQVLAQHRQVNAVRLAQNTKQWQPVITPPAHDLTIGVMGLGKLGTAAASSLQQLGYQVIGWAGSQHHIDNVKCYTSDQKQHFLTQTDILVCLLPLTDDTRNILCGSLFSMLKPGAGLINAARGEHLVEEDLLQALDSGQIAHATLDVFRQEPLPQSHPFWVHEKITVTPHIASLIDPESGGKEIARNLLAFINGEPIEDMTDTTRGY